MEANFLDALIQAMIMRSVGGAAGESTIEERWSDIVASRHTVRVKQFIGAVVGSLVAFLGLLLVGLPLTLSGAVASLSDAILVGCAAALAAVIFWAGVELSFREYAPRRRVVITCMGIVLILAGVVLGALRFGDLEWWHSLSVVVGLAIAGPAVAFVFNQTADLLDPMGWVSAFERRIMPVLEKWMEGQNPSAQLKERPLFPWRHGGREQYMAARGKDGKGPANDIPATDDLTLADFLLEATKRPLGRDRHWLGPGKIHVCPTTGVRVTRPTYDKMIAMMERVGYIERGGDGEATQWLTEPQAAYDDWCSRLEDEWGETLGGGFDARDNE